MDPRFLNLYNQELAFMRDMGTEFAQAFPKIAGRLAMRPDEVSDPTVERLFEGFAFMAARTQFKLQARFPDFTQHLLSLVYPHLLAPVPSMAVVRFEPDFNGGRLENGYLISRGTTLTAAASNAGSTTCQFRTSQDVRIWPLEISGFDYVATPSQLSALRLPERDVKAVIRLRLKTTNGTPLDRLALRALQLYFPRSDGIGSRIVEQLLFDTVRIVARPMARPAPWQEELEPNALRHVGLAPEEAILPCPDRSFDGYRLLQEYFALPERTLFVEISRLADIIAQSGQEEIEFNFCLGRADSRLERQISTAHVYLFATPIVNLFEKHADRIQISERVNEHHVVVDRTRPLDFEVHSILSVQGVEEGEETARAFAPLYSLNDRQTAGDVPAYYTARRERRQISTRQRREGTRTPYIGSEVFLSLVDAKAAPFSRELRQLQVRCLCSNRDLPLLMTRGEEETDFWLDIGAPVTAVRCVAGPSTPFASAAEGDVAWRLISHLSLNYLSLTNSADADADGADGLREMLALYTDSSDAATMRQIEAVRSIDSRPIIRRLPGGGQAAVARGLSVDLHFDENGFEGLGVFPLAATLSRFFAKYVSINSFTETTLFTPQRGAVARWGLEQGRRQSA